MILLSFTGCGCAGPKSIARTWCSTATISSISTSRSPNTGAPSASPTRTAAIDAYGTDVYAVKATAEYHGSATYDDVLDIGCRVGRIGRSSLQFVFGIWRGDEHVTSGELIYVNADPKTQQVRPWPEAFRRRCSTSSAWRPNRAAVRGADHGADL